MGKGIILRVLEGTVLSPELSRTLDTLLPNYKLEYYQERPNYRRSIERRIDSLHNAFLFILDAYPPDPKYTALKAETFKAYAEECKASCDLNKETVEELHKELEKYTAKLVDVLSVGWKWSKNKAVKESINCLNEAEQYVLMSQGRPDLATLMPMQIGSEIEYILQYDESLPPHSEQFLGELELIKAGGFPKTPLWFRKIPEYQKVYFSNLKFASITPIMIIQDLNAFIETWEQVKQKSFGSAMELRQIYSNTPPYPSWFNDLSFAQQSMVKVLAADPANFDNNLREFKSFVTAQSDNVGFKNILEPIAKLPLWYWSLSKIQQIFLASVVGKVDRLEDAVSFLSSRHRTLPLPANFAVHSLRRINNKGECKSLYGERYRSSHIVSRDGLDDYPAEVQQRHSDSNLATVMRRAKLKQLRILQTLISPIHAVEYLPSLVLSCLPELPPDLELYKMARSAVQRSDAEQDTLTLQHNHPFNIAKYIYYTSSTDPDSLFLLKTAQDYVADTPGLQELIDDYRSVLESPMGSATVWDYVGRELFLSSLEQLIILTIGGYSYGSCVSGKDRKAVELMHTDAMILYKEKYGIWPKFGVPSDKIERINFINTFADIYMTRHQHEHAGQSAPGSEGIKTPSWYLPEDISAEINIRLGTPDGLVYDDRLATDNEVKNISKSLKSYFFPKNELLCKLTARQLGEAICTSLYDSLNAFINEVSRFQSETKTWSGFGLFDSKNTPTGIRGIREVMEDEHAGEDNVVRLEKIFTKVLSRPVRDEKDETRTKETKSVYNRIRDLLQPVGFGTPLEELAYKAVNEWKKLFAASKTEHSSLVCF